MRSHRGGRRALWLVALAGLVPACGGSEDAAGGAVIEIVAEDYAFQVPRTIPVGPVGLQLANRGSESHAAQLYRLNDGATIDDFVRAMRSGIAEEREVATVVGGPANVDGGDTGPVVEVALEPGDYVVVCWLLDAARNAHAFRGMYAEFRVTGTAGTATPPPAPDGTIEVSEYEIRVPDDFDGAGRFRVVNRGSEWHELVILEIGEDVGPLEAIGHLTGVERVDPVPYTSRGGTTAVEVDGGAATVDLDLGSGRYVFLCAVPNVNDVYHAFLGMWTEVRVG